MKTEKLCSYSLIKSKECKRIQDVKGYRVLFFCFHEKEKVNKKRTEINLKTTQN
jgi:hypothetical protein